MNNETSTPQWLLDAIASAVTTKEYDEFSKGFADLMHQQLSQNHLTSFADLSEAEKQPFVDSTMTKLANTAPAEALSYTLSSKLDESLHAWVGKQLLIDGVYSDGQITRTDLQLDCLCDAVVAIVRQFPFLRYRLRVLFNHDIPKKLRPPVWHAFLQNSKIRRQYMNRVATDPRRGLSAMDGEIAKKCDSLLSEHAAFAKFKGSTGALYTMRTAVSYYHNLVDAGNTLLAQSEFLLFCPLLYHVSSSIPRRQPPQPALITLLVEEYISFLESRPAFVCKPSLDDEQCKQFFICVANALQKLNPDLVKLISQWPARALPEGYPSSAGLSAALAALAQPLVRNMFVGFVNYRVLLFIWDQYFLGLDITGFACELLSVFVAIILHLASSTIVASLCESVADAIECIREYGLTIQVQQMRYTLYQHFGKQFAALLPSGEFVKTAGDFAGQPPVLLISPGYDGRPTDRLRERQQIEQARQRQTDDNKKKDDDMKARMADLEATLQRRLNESEQKFATVRQQFEDQLRAERERKSQVEERAVQEAAGLRAEVDRLRRDRDLLGRRVEPPPVAPGAFSALANVVAEATPEVQHLINHYLGHGYDPASINAAANQSGYYDPANQGTLDLTATQAPPPSTVVQQNALPPAVDPRYEDPLKFVDAPSKLVLSGLVGTAGPSAARLAHGGTGSTLTTPGFTVVNPGLDQDGQRFVERLRAAFELAEKQLFGRVLDAAALAEMSEADRQMAVSRILANVASAPA